MEKVFKKCQCLLSGKSRIIKLKVKKISSANIIDRWKRFRRGGYLSADDVLSSDTERIIYVKEKSVASMKMEMKSMGVCIKKVNCNIIFAKSSFPAGESGYCNHLIVYCLRLLAIAYIVNFSIWWKIMYKHGSKVRCTIWKFICKTTNHGHIHKEKSCFREIYYMFTTIHECQEQILKTFLQIASKLWNNISHLKVIWQRLLEQTLLQATVLYTMMCIMVQP